MPPRLLTSARAKFVYHDRLNWVPFDCVERDSNFLSALQTFRAHSELDACTAKARTNYFITWHVDKKKTRQKRPQKKNLETKAYSKNCKFAA